MSTSIHEITWRLKAINKRTNANRKFTASLYGYELRVPGELEDSEDEMGGLSNDEAKRIMEESHRRRLDGN